jgi:hypothetical protein
MAERSAKSRVPVAGRGPHLGRSIPSATQAPVWHSRAFWDDVEYEVAAPDPYDLLEFLTADERPIESRPGFRDELRTELAVLVRRRYQQ